METKEKKFFHDTKAYFWDNPYLFKEGKHGVLRRCIPYKEVGSFLYHCHNSKYGGHFGSTRTISTILQYGLCWHTIFKDAFFMWKADKCQIVGNIPKRDEMPLNNILTIELFYIYGIEFMGSFPSSFGSQYILVATDYVFQVASSHH